MNSRISNGRPRHSQLQRRSSCVNLYQIRIKSEMGRINIPGCRIPGAPGCPPRCAPIPRYDGGGYHSPRVDGAMEVRWKRDRLARKVFKPCVRGRFKLIIRISFAFPSHFLRICLAFILSSFNDRSSSSSSSCASQSLPHSCSPSQPSPRP